MTTDTANRILSYIRDKKEATPKEIIQFIGLGAPSVFRQLKKLQEQGVIKKMGTSPRVFYIPNITVAHTLTTLQPDIEKTINTEYIIFTPQGEMLNGVPGFAYWCQQQNLPVEKTAQEYVSTLAKYNSFKNNNTINATGKLRQTFPDTALDEIYYLDFYSRERFGKTKLGSLVLYAKQSQNKKLIHLIYELASSTIQQIISEHRIDAIGFIPPTIPRKTQILKELENLFNFPTAKIKIVKATADIPVPQKSLSKIADRIQNARDTIFIDDHHIHNNILLIDDAVGSGSTLNETAKKIKNKKLCTGKIIGLALVGSFKGFDVIQEI